MMSDLPNSVRYIKNGTSGRWWEAAKTERQLHLGWDNIPFEYLKARDFDVIEQLLRTEFGSKRGAATNDIRALRTALDKPSRHIWVTFEEGRMWWCTVLDEVNGSSSASTRNRGHFWLTCDRPWSDHALDNRLLALADLPGTVGSVAGFRATICEPKGAQQILRIIRGEKDVRVVNAEKARHAYAKAVKALIAELRPKDFEVLIDLILSRTGWVRIQKVGGSTEGIDIEVENDAAREIAFVQVKSAGDQSLLDHYIGLFQLRRDRYSRMIFAVHTTPKATPTPPAGHSGQAIQVWTVDHIAELVVKHGLGEWVAKKF